jgi:DNA topoisomerase-1
MLGFMRLRKSTLDGPGITRRRCGRGFTYVNSDGERVDDGERARIESLAIPPAWDEVWICPDSAGHVQATGVDAAGRRQYLYHPLWRERQDEDKWRRVESFARALPELRERADVCLRQRALTRERVLALAITLLDQGLFRVGSEQYETCGLATIHLSSVRLHGDCVDFDYVAKHQVRQQETIRSARVARIVRRLAERERDPELLAWRDAGEWHDVKAADINEFIRESIPDASAKDFRSWHGTVLAAAHLADGLDVDALPYANVARDVPERRDPVLAAVEHVAAQMGNTATVARASYIDPRVLDAFADGRTVDAAARAVDVADDSAQAQAALEAGVLRLLEGGGARAVANAAMAASGA